jgi:hypothetical protein
MRAPRRLTPEQEAREDAQIQVARFQRRTAVITTLLAVGLPLLVRFVEAILKAILNVPSPLQ